MASGVGDRVVRNAFDGLSPRERDCLRLAATTDSQKVIALELGLAPSTVYTHLANAREKLGVATTTQAAVLFRQYEAEGAPQDWGGQSEALPDAPKPDLAPGTEAVAGAPQALRPAGPGAQLRALFRLPTLRKPGGGNELSTGQRLRDSVQTMLLAVFAFGTAVSAIRGVGWIAVDHLKHLFHH